MRRPLRPLARILSARAAGADPDRIEAEARLERLRARHRLERERAEARLLFLGLAFVLVGTVIIARMGLMAMAEPVEPRSMAGAERIEAGRADIIDRHGRVLATNIVTASLYAQPEQMVDPRAAADGLARIFPDIDADRLYAQLTDGRRFMWIRRTLSPEQRQAVHDLGEPGLLFGPRQTRFYPAGPVAAHILGGASFGREGVSAAEVIGVAGIEQVFDAALRDPAHGGAPLRLSLDLDVQVAMEEVLEAGMARMNARGAVGIIMEAATGQIIAMASLPDFDPNRRPPPALEGDPSDSPLFNRAAQGRYELGSTLKLFPVAQALEEGRISPNTMIDTRGPMQWGRFTIRDFRYYGPQMSVTDVIARSSNIGAARIAMERGGAAQRAFLDRLGLMEPVPVELVEAGRTAPLLPDRWSELTTMTVAYGHGIAITPLHLASAYASLVNGGLRVRPSLVLSDRRPTEADRIVSETTSAQLRQMLRETVTRGTATFADIPGYEVAGKTGTADKPAPGGGYAHQKVIASFVGVFPASDPQYVILVSLDEPVNREHAQPLRTAGWTATPVAGDVIRRVGPLLGLRPAAPAMPGLPLVSIAASE